MIFSFNDMKQVSVTFNNITIQVDDIKTFFKSIVMDDEDMINEVVDKEGSLGGFAVHFDKGWSKKILRVSLLSKK